MYKPSHCAVIAAICLFGAGTGGIAQITSLGTATVLGQVTDLSGAVMQSVPVRIFGDADAPVAEGLTDAGGDFSISLPAGDYRIEVSAPAFETYSNDIAVRPGMDPIAVVLDLASVAEDLVVNATMDELIADTSMSLMSTTLSGDELLGLPATEDELAVYLMLLAGVDTTGDLEEDILANFVIDGFDDGRLPRADQIQQIIIDPNSLSADGGGARIEIVTRPGSDRWRRSIGFNFADEALNALTPGEVRKEPRQTRDLEFSVSGPLIPDFLEIDVEASTRVQERAGNSLRAVSPSGSFFRGIVQPEREKSIEIETEMSLAETHTLRLDYAYSTTRLENSGVGGLTLPERGSDSRANEWSFDVRDRTFGDTHTNDLQFQVSYDYQQQVPLTQGFAFDVAGSFNGGGGTERNITRETRVQAENRLRWERGKWRYQWGVESAYWKASELTEDNFNGTYEFSSLHDYCYATGFDGSNCLETRQIVEEARANQTLPVFTDGQGSEVEITGVPATFTQTSGNGDIVIDTVSINTFFQADRALGDRASLRMGLAYGATNRSVDYLRVNPTLNFQYRLFEDTLVSVGTQATFDDFDDYETLVRNDGTAHLRQFSISSPSYPDPFIGGQENIDADTTSLWVLDSDYQSPYTFRPQLSLNQDIPGGVRLLVSYAWNIGIHQQWTRNVNAPYPGTPLPAEILSLPREQRQEAIDRLRPLYPVVGNIYQIESSGRSMGRDFRFRFQPRRDMDLLGMRFSGRIEYRYRSGEDDNDFNNPYIRLWGPSQRQHRVQSQFRVRMPEDGGFSNGLLRTLARATYAGTNFNFNFRANTGSLYSLQTGSDLNGDQSGGDRPPGVGRNTEVGPGRWNLGMTFTKDLYAAVTSDGASSRLEPPRQGRGDGGRRRGGRGPSAGETRVRLRARVNNLFNHSQPQTYNGVLSSPFFGEPIGFSGGRTISLSMNVDF